MNRRSFLKSFFVVAGVATVAPEMLFKPDLRQIDFSIHEEMGTVIYNPMALEQMADAFAAVQRQSFAPQYMFVHPQVYKEWNPEGYAKLVALQEQAT